MFDSKCYFIKYVQKSSPKQSDDFIFAEIFKFFTNNKLKYIIRAEMHPLNIFTVKYYAARDKKLENKYNRLTNQNDAIRVILTCASVLPILLEKYPTASFAFNSSRTIDLCKKKIEGYNNNQRFRIYSYITDAMVGRKTFDHYSFEGISSYLLINKKYHNNTKEAKDKIQAMFIQIYNFSSNI